MSLLVTFPDLRPLIRSVAGVERVRLIDDVKDLNPWIVDAWYRLYDLYAQSGFPYFEKEATIAYNSAASPPLGIPGDFYSLVRVDYLDADGSTSELVDLDVHQVSTLTRPGSTVRAIGYRRRQREIQLRPAPPDGQNYLVTYVPTPTTPAADVDQFDVVDVTGRRWIVLQVAIAVLTKQKEDPSALMEQAAEVLAGITKKVTRPTMTRTGKVADVTSSSFEDPFLSGMNNWNRR